MNLSKSLVLAALLLGVASTTASASTIDTDRRSQSCAQGTRDGQRAVNDIFRNDCNTALSRSFTRDVNRMSNRRFGSTRGGNWRDRAYNQCARDAIDREVNRIGRQCLNSNKAADDCNDLGREAARAIVRQNDVCPTRKGYGASSQQSRRNPLKKFQRSCRRVAYGVCQGFISNAANECGGRLSLRTQQDLQSQCRSQVNSWTSAANDLAAYSEFDAQALQASSFIASDEEEEQEYGVEEEEESPGTDADVYDEKDDNEEEDPSNNDNNDGSDEEDDGPTKATKWTRNAADKVADGSKKAADKVADGSKKAANDVAEWGKKTFDPSTNSANNSVKSLVAVASTYFVVQVLLV